jgi:hypothetical protein
MLFALVYSLIRLLLDLVDVRLRVRDPEAELLLLRHQLRVVCPSGQETAVEYGGSDDHGGVEPADEPGGSSREAGPAGDGAGLAPRLSEKKVDNLRSPACPWSARSRSRAPAADSADGQGQPEWVWGSETPSSSIPDLSAAFGPIVLAAKTSPKSCSNVCSNPGGIHRHVATRSGLKPRTR